VKQYIVNLTNEIIGRHGLDEVFERFPQDKVTFIQQISPSIEVHHVRKMNPETLGRILCSLEVGDVMASRKELSERIYFAGDCEDLLRSLVVTCLAYAITERLSPKRLDRVPAYTRRKHFKVRAGRFQLD
jgi:hypothetical protein